MTIGILGYGAVGLSLYSELHEKEKDNLYFIADEERIKRYKLNSIIINDKEYNPNFSSTIICDLIIVCVKCYNLIDSIKTLKKHINKNTYIIPLLNGISAYDILAKELNCNVLYGTINVISNKDNNNVKCEKIINLQYGFEYNDNIDNGLLKIKEIFDNSNVNNNIYQDMKKRVWLKWMLNMGINQLSALLDINYIEMSEEHNLKILELIFKEVLKVAEAYNINLTLDDVSYTMDLCKKSFNTTRVTSLTLDVRKGSIGELDYFSTTLLDLAKEKGISLPINYCFNQLIKVKVVNYHRNEG